VDIVEACNNVGHGWTDLVGRYFGYVSVINCACDADNVIRIEIVEVSRGMLRIVAKHDSPLIQEILDKLSWAIERDSAKICEVCGEKGYRRKSLPGSPNRCRKHYIELSNDMAERGEI